MNQEKMHEKLVPKRSLMAGDERVMGMRPYRKFSCDWYLDKLTR